MPYIWCSTLWYSGETEEPHRGFYTFFPEEKKFQKKNSSLTLNSTAFTLELLGYQETGEVLTLPLLSYGLSSKTLFFFFWLLIKLKSLISVWTSNISKKIFLNKIADSSKCIISLNNLSLNYTRPDQDALIRVWVRYCVHEK
jgi:hypothetical protein